jgi:hypothetical protein
MKDKTFLELRLTENEQFKNSFTPHGNEQNTGVQHARYHCAGQQNDQLTETTAATMSGTAPRT